MLDKIVEVKKEELKNFTLPERVEVNHVSLKDSIINANHTIGLIAEVKKASPSKGMINENFDPVEVAKAYERAGADAISVLTDETFFKGSNTFLTDVKKHVNLPVLRKDFIIDKRQIEESKLIGADAILLIVKVLGAKKTKEFYDLAKEYNLECLVEVHSSKEIQALTNEFEPDIIGINNRNLDTFETSTKHTRDMSRFVPSESLLISESGISNHHDIQDVIKAGASGVLVGEALMRGGRFEERISDLFRGTVYES
ncbi:indole-3-glycerol phosphate synthase TrpC [Alkalihalobacillus sp. CinArs1]|uniref:indole-3-glycerol phosphate synthase TrpC n=1 Tax=Alkalihalobacillus sp. CinArs1 TaxID=2995314 RepID=UPI0022DE31E7|nr:indole-3-glycerol phosphate synthase TrpC [Alkalihalobacillus sp. CinArs1]